MLPQEIRSAHPYFMYEEIFAQPDALARTISMPVAGLRLLGEAAALARRIYLVGCGTSLHAAWVGQYLFESLLPEVPVRALLPHEMEHYGAPVEPEDLVIGVSHSGGTGRTVAALTSASVRGARTVALTGFPKSALAAAAQHVLPTGYAGEKSWAHTVSYTTQLALLTRFALEARGSATPAELRDELLGVPAKIRAALELAPRVERLAQQWRDRRRFFFLGAGPNWPTAAEAALKMEETNYSVCEAFEIEQFLHGPLASADENTVVVLLSAHRAKLGRCLDAARVARRVGSMALAVVGPGQEELTGAVDAAFELPAIAELLSPILFVVPMQILSYFLALARGVNPDLLRRDDPKYREARALYST